MKERLEEQSRTDLVKYRIERADETLQEARLLAKEGYYNAAFNRLYYACFYSALALLVKNGISTSSHAGVKINGSGIYETKLEADGNAIVFSLLGIKHNQSPLKGINIARLPNGTVIKTMSR